MSDNPLGSAASGNPGASNPDAQKLKRKMEEEDTTQLNVEIPESLHRRLKVKSAQTGKSLKKLTAQALRDFLS